jgi:hypothetical protein
MICLSPDLWRQFLLAGKTSLRRLCGLGMPCVRAAGSQDGDAGRIAQVDEGGSRGHRSAGEVAQDGS